MDKNEFIRLALDLVEVMPCTGGVTRLADELEEKGFFEEVGKLKGGLGMKKFWEWMEKKGYACGDQYKILTEERYAWLESKIKKVGK